MSRFPREALSFFFRIHSLFGFQQPHDICSLITAVIYLTGFYSILVTGSQLLVPTPRHCHLMGSSNRMGPVQLMRVTHRRWVGVMTRIPLTRWNGESAAKRHYIFSLCRNRFSEVVLLNLKKQHFSYLNLGLYVLLEMLQQKSWFQSHSLVSTHPYTYCRWELVCWRRFFFHCYQVSSWILLCSQWDLPHSVWLNGWLCCFSALKCRASKWRLVFFHPLAGVCEVSYFLSVTLPSRQAPVWPQPAKGRVSAS